MWGLGEVPPSYAANNFANSLRAYCKFESERVHADQPWNVSAADRRYLSGGKFGGTVLFSVWAALRIKPRSALVSTRLAVFGYLVGYIHIMSANEQVSRIATCGRVAGMTDKQPLRN